MNYSKFIIKFFKQLVLKLFSMITLKHCDVVPFLVLNLSVTKDTYSINGFMLMVPILMILALLSSPKLTIPLFCIFNQVNFVSSPIMCREQALSIYHLFSTFLLLKHTCNQITYFQVPKLIQALFSQLHRLNQTSLTTKSIFY